MADVVPLSPARWPFVGFVRSFFPNLANQHFPFAVGTAFLINPAVALTAAHVVYDTFSGYGGLARSVDITFPGQPTIGAAEFIPTNEWITQDSANNNPLSRVDIAAIFFNPPLTSVPFVDFGSGVGLAQEITVVGYTGNNYPRVPFFGGTSFPITSPDDAFRIAYPFATLGGMSGGPVYSLDASNRPTVRGIHTSLLDNGMGDGLRFTDGILELINKTWLKRP
jgi:V8-like Glu-specific endopeptidase